MTNYDVVMKLIGRVHPIGETNEDDRRFENLKLLTRLVDELFFEIDSVSRFKDRPEFSMKRAGEMAAKFMQQIKQA